MRTEKRKYCFDFSRTNKVREEVYTRLAKARKREKFLPAEVRYYVRYHVCARAFPHEEARIHIKRSKEDVAGHSKKEARKHDKGDSTARRQNACVSYVRKIVIYATINEQRFLRKLWISRYLTCTGCSHETERRNATAEAS